MPKKDDAITGTNNAQKMIIQKSNPLIALCKSDYSLAELKILDLYLARINSHAPQKRTVQISKSQLEDALGVSRIRKDDLKSRLSHLYQPIDIADGDDQIHLIGLFEEAKASQDKDGAWQISLRCTDPAMKYIFNVEPIGYLRYKLRSVTSLTSRYTYVLFLYLEKNRYRKTWDIDLSTLRQMLRCDTEETYQSYKRFNDLVLKKCQRELHEKTDCRFAYTPIRRGRSVFAIRIEIAPLEASIEEELQGKHPDQLTIYDIDPELGKIEQRERRADAIGFGFDDEIFDEFTDAELVELKSLARTCVDQATVDMHYARLGDRQQAQDCATAEYIIKKIKAMDVYDQRKPIKNRYSYLKKSIIKDGN